MTEHVPLIVVEGPDGSGKSTVIKNLGYDPIKFRALRTGVGASRPDGTCGETTGDASGWAGNRPAFDAYRQQVKNARPGTAFDRFHLSEIVCLPPFETTFANVTLPGRERPAFQTEEFLRRAYGMWQAVALNHIHLPLVQIFDYTRDSAEALATWMDWVGQDADPTRLMF